MDDKKSLSHDILKIIVSAVTLLTPLIYLIGLNFFSGIFHGYGISSSYFPSSIEGNMTGAYYFIATVIADLDYQWYVSKHLIKIVFYVVTASFGLLAFELWIKKMWVLLRSKFKPHGYDREQAFTKLNEDKYIDHNVFTFTLVFMLIIHIPITAAAVGKKSAHKFIDEFKHKGCVPRKNDNGWNRCVTIISKIDNRIVERGILIAVSEKKIAIYTENKSRVLNYLDEYEVVSEYENKSKDE